jgi:hypothetical protein
MSNHRSTLNKTDPDFIAFANAIGKECTDHQTEWGIDANKIADLQHLLDEANQAYAINKDRVKKNAGTAADKRQAFANLKHFLSRFINYLEATDTVPDIALAALHLRPRHRQAYHPLPRPNDPLTLSITIHRGEMTLRALRPSHGHPTAGIGRLHHHGFMIQYRIEDEDKYRVAISTRQRHTLFFDPTDRGKHVHIIAAWVNPRLEPGPWSEEYIEIIG